MDKSVLLPEPEGPSIATNSPAETDKSKLSNIDKSSSPSG